MTRECAETLPTSDGAALEARLALPEAPAAGIVICHPHPLYGGDMDNPVVARLAEVGNNLGFATLRFNFRGVGASTGVHDGGGAEQHDVEAALARLRSALDAKAPLFLAGYSFGAMVGAELVGARGGAGLAGLVLVAPPLGVAGQGPFQAIANSGLPLLIVAGSDDEFCPLEATEALAGRLPGMEVRTIEGANHFFFGKLFPLGEAVADWVQRLKARQASGRPGAA